MIMKIPNVIVLLISAAFLILCGFSISDAQSWKLVYIDETGSELYVDTDSQLALDEGIVRFWEKTATRMPSDTPMLFLVDLDCHFEAIRILKAISLDSSSSQQNTPLGKWQSLDEMGNLEIRERLHKLICGDMK